MLFFALEQFRGGVAAHVVDDVVSSSSLCEFVGLGRGTRRRRDLGLDARPPSVVYWDCHAAAVEGAVRCITTAVFTAGVR